MIHVTISQQFTQKYFQLYTTIRSPSNLATGWHVANATLAATCLELLGGLQPGCPGFSLHICSWAMMAKIVGDFCAKMRIQG